MRHPARARYLAVLVLAALIVGLFVRISTIENSNARAAILPLLPTSQELAAALYRAGLDPEALAAAGVSPAAASGVVGNVIDHIVAHPVALEQADTAVATLRQQCGQLKRVVQAGLAGPEQVAAYQVARVERAQAELQQREVVNALFTAGTADLGNAQRGALTAIRSNRRWTMPIEFLLVERNDSQWLELRECLADERVAAKLDRPPDADSQAALNEIRAHPAVTAAKANVDANLSVVNAAWDQAVGD